VGGREGGEERRVEGWEGREGGRKGRGGEGRGMYASIHRGGGIRGAGPTLRSDRPFAHGKMVIPSGRFPSFRDKDGGSNNDSISADACALLMRLFDHCTVTHIRRPADLRQARPWEPEQSTCSPHMQI
jgi:hypothetical protein